MRPLEVRKLQAQAIQDRLGEAAATRLTKVLALRVAELVFTAAVVETELVEAVLEKPRMREQYMQ